MTTAPPKPSNWLLTFRFPIPKNTWKMFNEIWTTQHTPQQPTCHGLKVFKECSTAPLHGDTLAIITSWHRWSGSLRNLKIGSHGKGWKTSTNWPNSSDSMNVTFQGTSRILLGSWLGPYNRFFLELHSLSGWVSLTVRQLAPTKESFSTWHGGNGWSNCRLCLQTKHDPKLNAPKLVAEQKKSLSKGNRQMAQGSKHRICAPGSILTLGKVCDPTVDPALGCIPGAKIMAQFFWAQMEMRTQSEVIIHE